MSSLSVPASLIVPSCSELPWFPSFLIFMPYRVALHSKIKKLSLLKKCFVKWYHATALSNCWDSWLLTKLSLTKLLNITAWYWHTISVMSFLVSASRPVKRSVQWPFQMLRFGSLTVTLCSKLWEGDRE